MKKLFSILTILMIATTAWAEEVQWTEVSTAQELKQAIDATIYAKIRLKNDINVASLEAEGNDCLFGAWKFSGTVTGENSRGTDYAIIYGNTGNDKALFGTLSEATISHLRFVNFNNASQDNSTSVYNATAYGILSQSSNGSNIDHVAFENCSVTNKKYFWGSVAGKSTSDNISYCSTASNCLISASGDKIGGIIGYTTEGSKISYCYNAATVKGGFYTGGIVGHAEYDCEITNCLNVGNIVAKQYVGGIAGCNRKTSIYECVNTGHLDVPDNDDYQNRGGITGYNYEGQLDYCYNYGSINHVTILDGYGHKVDGMIGGNCWSDSGQMENGTFGEHNYYYCLIDGKFYCKSGDENDAIFNTMWTGEHAATTLGKSGTKFLYESIDNGRDNYGATFVVGSNVYKVPVPLPGAGEVYSNILCYGIQTYSNKYHSTGEHNFNGRAGACTICGYQRETPGHIKSAEDLLYDASIINNVGYSSNYAIFYLDNDIDMAGVEFTPIGKDFEHPFRGTFDGQGHRIKNLKVNVTNGCAGLFGCVSGTTVICNLIIDSSCEINSTGYGAAGIVGCLARAEEGLREPINLVLTNCGNEATVNGDINAAGLVGGVYNTEKYNNATVTITNCYNTGNITGSGVGNGESAALIAYGNSKTTVKNCYNTGTVEGNWEGLSLVRVKTGSEVTLRNIYNLESVAAQNSDDCQTVTADQVRIGDLCSNLRTGEKGTVWAQNLETDAYPTFGTAGVHYARSMANEWGTIVLPFDVDYSKTNGNYKFYKLKAADLDEFTLTEYATGIIAAGTPMVVKILKGDGIDIAPASTPNYSAIITAQNTENASLPAGWEMRGTYSKRTGKRGIFYIAGDLVWYAEDPISIAPYRAWFAGPASTSGAALRIVESDGSETSVIGEITTDGNVNFYDTPIYTIQGQRQQAGQKGLQIRNGKVVFINN